MSSAPNRGELGHGPRVVSEEVADPIRARAVVVELRIEFTHSGRSA